MPWAFLVVSLIGAWHTLNAFLPVKSKWLMVPGFFAAWLTSELAPHHLVWQGVATALFAWAGAFDDWPGLVGLAVTVVSWGGLVALVVQSHRAEKVLDEALRTGLGVDWSQAPDPEVVGADPAFPWRQLVLPFRMRRPGVQRVKDVVYGRAGGRDLRLDVYCPRAEPPAPAQGRPTLLYLHGGGWMVGTNKRHQGLPLMLHLAARGWVCVTADYRLSPHATFPEHLVDCKRALAWIRQHGHEYGADPGFVAVSGGSAGGHLAALVALTPNDPEYQPGFEAVDTRVQAGVPFYGIYDFTNRDRVRDYDDMVTFLERHVMKTSLADDPEAFAKASPMDRVHPDAPPFMVVHGSLDRLAPVAEARRFVELLRAVSAEPVVYAELPGAQHAFEVFPSIRTVHAVRAVERFLWGIHARYRRHHPGVPAPAVPDERPEPVPST
jgi:acetyl esterase/lipase